MGMFANLGRTLSLLRELRGKSQSRVAREARIGKSQLSKYENGKELPKLDSLEKILRVLKVDMFEFFYTLYLVDGRAAALAQAAGVVAAADLTPAGPDRAAGAARSCLGDERRPHVQAAGPAARQDRGLDGAPRAAAARRRHHLQRALPAHPAAAVPR